MSSRSVHGQSFWAWLFHRPLRYQPTGWQRYPQREQNTDSVPAQQAQAVRYPLHQREDDRPFLRWRNQQPVLRPRMVVETAPKFCERDGRMQTIDPQIASYQPSQRLRRVTGPHTPLPATQSNPMQLLSQDELPDWMRRPMPKARDRYALEKVPIDELPTVPDANRLARDAIRALPAWQAPAIQFWTGPDADFDENRWLNEPAPAVVPPVLAPLDSQALSVVDRTASSALVELANQEENNETVEVPAYMRKRAMQMQQQLRESE